jgi:CelD/BcsL family acetyltransferase involved in cellulose biosynthesis
VQVIDSLHKLETLAPRWTELHQRCPRATPFQSPQWLLPWTRHLFGGGEIQALEMREGDALIGLAPLFRWGIGTRNLSFLGAGVSDYGDVLFAPGREADCAAAVADFVRHRADRLRLDEVRDGSALLREWPAQPCSVCPVLDLHDYPESMAHSHRVNLRHAHNRLDRYGDSRFSKAAECSLQGHIDEFFRLHELRWGALEPRLRGFYIDAARELLAAGSLRLCLLEIDGRAAAAAYAFTRGTTLYYYLTGFDPALAKVSPGALLLEWMIEQARAEGIAEVDFLRHSEAYKYLWGARDRVNYRITRDIV